MIGRLWAAAVNQLLAREPWAAERLAPFCGRTLRVVAPGDRGFTLVVDARGHLSPAEELPEDAAPDATVELAALVKIALGPPGREDLVVEGSADLAQAVRYVAAHLRWDAEEDLARLVGDIAANRIVRAVRAARTVQREGAERLAANLAEYLTEEKRWLVSRAAFDGFSADVKALQSASDALAARLAGLEGR